MRKFLTLVTTIIFGFAHFSQAAEKVPYEWSWTTNFNFDAADYLACQPDASNKIVDLSPLHQKLSEEVAKIDRANKDAVPLLEEMDKNDAFGESRNIALAHVGCFVLTSQGVEYKHVPLADKDGNPLIFLSGLYEHDRTLQVNGKRYTTATVFSHGPDHFVDTQHKHTGSPEKCKQVSRLASLKQSAMKMKESGSHALSRTYAHSEQAIIAHLSKNLVFLADSIEMLVGLDKLLGVGINVHTIRSMCTCCIFGFHRESQRSVGFHTLLKQRLEKKGLSCPFVKLLVSANENYQGSFNKAGDAFIATPTLPLKELTSPNTFMLQMLMDKKETTKKRLLLRNINEARTSGVLLGSAMRGAFWAQSILEKFRNSASLSPREMSSFSKAQQYKKRYAAKQAKAKKEQVLTSKSLLGKRPLAEFFNPNKRNKQEAIPAQL